MRIALFSDIHGNSIALEAVLADIDRRGGVDGYWVLGDLAAIGHDPEGVLARVAALPNVVVTRGNTDRFLVTEDRPSPSIAAAQADPALVPQLVEMNAGFAWSQGIVTAAGWGPWLAQLPLEYRPVLPNGTRFLGVHCAPGADDGYGFSPALSEAQIAAGLAGCEADLVCVGHTHQAMDVHVNGHHLVNLGSVSNPKAPDLRASYALLTADETGYTLKLYYIEYDRQAVMDALEKVRYPGRRYVNLYMQGKIGP